MYTEGKEDATPDRGALNDLATLHAFPLLCAYPLRGFPGCPRPAAPHAVRGALPRPPRGELHALASPDERLRTIVQRRRHAGAEVETRERRHLSSPCTATRRNSRILRMHSGSRGWGWTASSCGRTRPSCSCSATRRGVHFHHLLSSTSGAPDTTHNPGFMGKVPDFL